MRAMDFYPFLQLLIVDMIRMFPIVYLHQACLGVMRKLLVHLADEATTFGSLDACSAFPFENYMPKLKCLVRSGRKPLIQVANRLLEMEQCQKTSGPTPKKKMPWPNKAYILAGDKCCEAAEGMNKMILCKVFDKVEPLFTEPCDSRNLWCYRARQRDAILKLVPEN